MENLTTTHNQPAYSVSELSGALKRVVEDSFAHVRVRGEISKVTKHASGHVYFDMKDERSVLCAVCWKGNSARLTHLIEMGLEVVASGRLSTFGGQSKYQLIVEHLEPAGTGALLALLEQRKKQFAAEGLFDEARKRPLPFLPQVIGVVTSPTGAVIRDILHRLSDRFPLHVLLWPVRVQGEGAAEEIAAAINGFNNLPDDCPFPRPDLLIVGRGGGSIEDLWCFNEECVVRAAAASYIPLISAVGHETDTTLIDHAADIRAPTPTAAAEMAVPVLIDILLGLQEAGIRMERCLHQGLELRRDRLRGLARGLPRPEDVLAQGRQRLDGLSERLTAAPLSLLRHRREQVKGLGAQLSPLRLLHRINDEDDTLCRVGAQLQLSLRSSVDKREKAFVQVACKLSARPLLQRVTHHREQLPETQLRIHRAVQRQWERRAERLSALGRMLETLDHREVLKRGFALVTDSGGRLISARSQLPNAPVNVQFHDGEARLQPIDGAARPLPLPRKAKAPKPDLSGRQGTLF